MKYFVFALLILMVVVNIVAAEDSLNSIISSIWKTIQTYLKQLLDLFQGSRLGAICGGIIDGK